MILSKLIKPKWQHRNPEVRRSALEKMDDLAVLSEIAQNDEDATVRRVAVRKIEDIQLLYQIFQKDPDVTVRELANQRFLQLLCGHQENPLDLAIRVDWLNKINDSNVLEEVAQQAPEVELRLAAILKVNREGLLGDLAINDPSSEVRLAAVAKLTQKSTLERVFKTSRNRDKRVSRIARDKLEVLLEQQERPKRIRSECETICSRLESLGRTQLWEQEYAEFNHLQERWQTVAAEAEPELLLRFTKARQDFMAAFERYQQTREAVRLREQMLRDAKEKLCLQTENLVNELQPLERISGELDETVQKRWELLQKEWKNTPVLEKTSEERQWQTRFEGLGQTLREYHKKLQTVHLLANTMEALCQRAENLLNSPQILTPEPLKELQTRWESIAYPAVPLLDSLTQRFKNTLEILQNRLQAEKSRREQVASQLKQTLSELEEALELGEFKKALPLEQQTRELLKEAVGINLNRYKKLEAIFQKCSHKINELRGWQRWGNKLEREKLCEQIEHLLNDENLQEALVQVQEAQNAWRRLGSSGYSQELWERFNQATNALYQRYREKLCQQIEDLPNQPADHLEEHARIIQKAQVTWKELGSHGHTQELWERFNKACNDAYEPCRLYFSRQAQERVENLAKKEAICERLENFQTNWEQPHWKEIYRFFREQEKEWRSIGAIERKSKKIIQKRYHKALQPLQVVLDEERQHNLQVRRRLIDQVKEVADRELEQATETVKHLQSQWQVTVPGTRREERELWREFRKACDAIFEQRKQQQEELKRELEVNLDKKVVLCEQVEDLAKLEGEALKTVAYQIKKLREEWDRVGPLPRKAGEGLERRFETWCRQVEMQRQAFLVVEQRRQLDLLKEKANLCLAVEAGELDLESAKIKWEALPKLENPEWEEAITERFEHTTDFQEREEALKAKKTFCIRMEILAGIDSPPAEMEARMAYQVARLTEAMTGGEKPGFKDKMTEVQEIEKSWYLSQAVASEYVGGLEQRFKRALEAFYGKFQGSR